ncbi:GTPase RsgA [Aneurinibacillus migulanus]|uniref:Small ribosomal subunit biogenesis GTPase RsgA n=1 Tax=Aneurinibacillus migulanus TaxID=47500 RepID=A0A0D1XUF3_ANEMI|nr:ribosome small subunit-dependent GTPase A [Aneurinibacillus migulanus]KIV53271.1 GTPase RsgA [Aneurinibacillus migulanus]KIV57836.1 GTPase RsgA [Aneurinibacillus migulanus]KON97408.1 GTPase RsgA [Aneurinibacillus migulanus]KPD07329.1 GTPase RsgA [Aneurinibacillus migulanus]MCP1356407.1 ribosome small subunit-dependent GTPase A [Aneurinibacillus migulanus]
MNQQLLEKLKAWGWNNTFTHYFTPYDEQGYSVGRVALEHKRMYRILTEHGELLAEVSGKMRYAATKREDYPAIGDWVVIRPRVEEKKATIHAVLPRKSKFSRKVAGETVEEQIVAANVDTVFLVNALNNDLNLRRIERYLILAWESGATPVIVLSKADLCNDVDRWIAEVQSIAMGVPIHAVSTELKDGLEELTPYLREGTTIALMGSSGVGKSTLINHLSGKDIQHVNEARQGDDRGRHTTTHRELFRLPGGGLMIDTPGMRELQLWEADEGFRGAFDDVESLTAACRFHDCRHVREPGCAVQAALVDGSLARSRFDSYLKLQRELAHLARKEDLRLQAAEKKKWKKVHMELRHRKPRR